MDVVVTEVRNISSVSVKALHLQQWPFFCREVEKIVRERFAKAVSRAMTELKIKQPTQSPINGLIENAVIEVGHPPPHLSLRLFLLLFISTKRELGLLLY